MERKGVPAQSKKVIIKKSEKIFIAPLDFNCSSMAHWFMMVAEGIRSWLCSFSKGFPMIRLP
jgi:hypothetical protein